MELSEGSGKVEGERVGEDGNGVEEEEEEE